MALYQLKYIAPNSTSILHEESGDVLPLKNGYIDVAGSRYLVKEIIDGADGADKLIYLENLSSGVSVGKIDTGWFNPRRRR